MVEQPQILQVPILVTDINMQVLVNGVLVYLLCW
uniref:Uncharacterized protein n=1 Tax=Rhizophora mucronata TaxID=61149 RepID=A0A2P2QG26_RHIMU